MNPETNSPPKAERALVKDLTRIFHNLPAKVLTLLFSLSLFVSSASAEFRAGISVRTVTPDPLLPVIGGVGPSHRVSRKR